MCEVTVAPAFTAVEEGQTGDVEEADYRGGEARRGDEDGE